MKKYTYIDKSAQPPKVLFAIAADMIAEADETFKEVTGMNPFQSHIATTISDIKKETVEN